MAVGRPPYGLSDASMLERIGPDVWAAMLAFADVSGQRQKLFDLLREVVEKRLELAEAHLALARNVQAGGTHGLIDWQKRHVISRGYYAMLHAARALFQSENGWDVDVHKSLPARWRSSKDPKRVELAMGLDMAREARNDADYKACYPRPPGGDARMVVRLAEKALNYCKQEIDARWTALASRRSGP